MFKYVFVGLVAALAGCGGGGSDNNTGAATAPVSVTPATPPAEGFWQGKTNNGRTIDAVVLEDGTYWALYSLANNPEVLAGVVQGTGTTTPGSFSSTNGRDFSLEAESITGATLSVSYAAKQFFNGSLTNQASANTITFTSSYGANYEQPASLTALAGTYAGNVATIDGTDSATISIGLTGALTGVSSAGCRFNGTASVHKAVNVYDLSIAFQGGTCSNGSATTSGIAYLEGSVLYAAALDSARNNGFLATVSKSSAR